MRPGTHIEVYPFALYHGLLSEDSKTDEILNMIRIEVIILDVDNKIIDINSRRKEIDDKTGEDGYEDWEDDYELISKGDYEGLKMLRQMIAKNNPEDIHAQWCLGEAYVLCKEYEKAIDYLKPLL